MGKISGTHHFERRSPVCLESRPSRINGADFNTLDDDLLNCTPPAMSPTFERRRESFADSVTTFPPSEGLWSGYQFGGEQVASFPSSSTPHGLPEHRHSTYHDATASLPVQYGQPAAWHHKRTSGSCTPTADYDGLNPEYEAARTAPYTIGAGHSAQAGTYIGLQVHTGPTFASHPTYPTSPQSAKDWMSASSSEALEYRTVAAHNSPQSPSFAANSLLLRRDGIRKKNARFEIPAERNLRTIDMMINQTNDEHEIKELKQQKRLLRNRQAALDSRQRKKQHTERLEEEKKHYTTIINELEEALGEMKVHEAEWEREKEGWATSQQQLKQYVDNLLMEKEELVRCHTIETGELRKRNTILSEQIQRIESTTMSTAPSSTGFSADFSDFDHLTMDSSPWDNFSLANDFSVETENSTGNFMSNEDKRSKPVVKEDDKVAASGFLLMLLLCGAWVASRGPADPSNVLPAMSDDMRVASATVLNHIYRDAGVQLKEIPCPTQQAVEVIPWNSRHSSERKTTLSAFEIASLSNAPLETLHQQLTAPSKKQLQDQAFSLSSIQYNDLSSDGDHDQPHAPKYHKHRNIGDALAALRGAQEGSAAEVYTRSILWDKVPKDVVRDFARKVAETTVDAQGSWKSEPLS
ncbi:hypothetical protein MMC26_007673 [Xylographa opegraphella]|nr:hypothetical protein [Xylographa opegraphella]